MIEILAVEGRALVCDVCRRGLGERCECEIHHVDCCPYLAKLAADNERRDREEAGRPRITRA